MPCQRQGIKCGMFVFTFEWLLYKGSCAKILGPVVHVVAPVVLRVYLYCHTHFSKGIWQSLHSHTYVHSGRHPHTHPINACSRGHWDWLSPPLCALLKKICQGIWKRPMVLSSWILRGLYLSPFHVRLFFKFTRLHLLLLYLTVRKWKWPYFVFHSGIGPEPKPKLKGDNRTFRVWLDPNQYQQDMTSSIQSGTEDPYETFNIIMRRKPKENNFKVCIPRLTSDQLSLYIVSKCFIFRPWALVFSTQPQSDVLHILHSLGYWSCKVGARAALRLPPTHQGLSNHPNERLFTLGIHVIHIPHLSPLRIP